MGNLLDGGEGIRESLYQGADANQFQGLRSGAFTLGYEEGGVRIIRVFPRRTKATPVDEDVRVNCGPELWDEADEVHISVAFTWDLPRAEWLAKQWAHVMAMLWKDEMGKQDGEWRKFQREWARPAIIYSRRAV